MHKNEFPFATEILDVYHATEHLKPLMLGLGLREGTKRWKRLHKYWKGRIAAGKIESVLMSLWDGRYGKLTEDVMREYKYFRSNKDRMKYDIRTLYKSNRLEEFFNHLVTDLPQVACTA